MNKNQIISLISKTRQDSSAFLEEELKAVGLNGLIASHGAILGALFRHDGKLKMKEIADLINRDKSTITYLVNRLNESGYVIRKKSGKDSRETYISLTDKGWAMEGKFNGVSEKLIKTAYKGFSEEEQETLLKLLQKLDNNFKEDLEDRTK